MSIPRDEADGDVSHDAWLREALRHAPDADALPPSTLSETILRQARAAAATPATLPAPSFAARLAAMWAWRGRPPVAAGFASVMVAGVVGLMWWDRPIEESLPPRDAAVPAAAQAPVPTPSPPPAIQAPDAAPPTPPSAEPARPAPRRAAAPTIAPAPARASPAPTTTPRAPTPDTTTAAGAAAGPALHSAESAARADTVPPAAPSAAPAERDTRAADAAAVVRQAERNEHARSVTALSKAAAPALRRDLAASVTALRSAVAAQPERWRWRRESGELRPVEPAFENWLGQLDSATASRWQADAADAAVGSREEATPLQLWLDGRLHGTLRLDAGGVGYEAAAPAPTVRQRAELPAAAAAALRTALDAATR